MHDSIKINNLGFIVENDIVKTLGINDNKYHFY